MFYISVKSSTVEAAGLWGIINGAVYTAAIPNVARWVLKALGYLIPTEALKKALEGIENRIGNRLNQLWQSANRRVVIAGDIILLLLGITLPLVSLPLAFDPYTHSSLQGSSISFDAWPQNAFCVPANGSYQVNAPNLFKWDHCFSDAGDFKNFVYEARMTIINGDCGGLLFRATEQLSDTYQFQVCQNGNYSLYYYNDKSRGPGKFTPSTCTEPNGSKSSCALANNTAAIIKQGENQSNVLAVAADGSTLKLYVNGVLLTSVEDQKFADGHIGVFAADMKNPTTVIFSDMKVWTL